MLYKNMCVCVRLIDIFKPNPLTATSLSRSHKTLRRRNAPSPSPCRRGWRRRRPQC